MSAMASPLLKASPRTLFLPFSIHVPDRSTASRYQLAVANSGIDSGCDNLQVGQTLCLGLAGQDCTTVYTVQAGDTCDAIATASSINTTMLNTNNPQIDAACDNIYIGEVSFFIHTSQRHPLIFSPRFCAWPVPCRSPLPLQAGRFPTPPQPQALVPVQSPPETCLRPPLSPPRPLRPLPRLRLRPARAPPAAVMTVMTPATMTMTTPTCRTATSSKDCGAARQEDC